MRRATDRDQPRAQQEDKSPVHIERRTCVGTSQTFLDGLERSSERPALMGPARCRLQALDHRAV